MDDSTTTEPGIQHEDSGDITLSPFYSAAKERVIGTKGVYLTPYLSDEWARKAGVKAFAIVMYLRVFAENQPATYQQIADGTRLGNSTVRRLVKTNHWLRSVIDITEKLPAAEAVRLCQTKHPSGFTRDLPGLRRCEWCRSKTFVLHGHHYPIPRSEGGSETINICPNCHAEFHHLTSDGFLLTLNEDGRALFMEVEE